MLTHQQSEKDDLEPRTAFREHPVANEFGRPPTPFSRDTEQVPTESGNHVLAIDRLSVVLIVSGAGDLTSDVPIGFRLEFSV